MADAIKVEVKDAQKAFFKVRARFQRLQRVVVGEALLEASEPIVAAAQANAPVRTGRLRGRIAPTLGRSRGNVAVNISAVKLSKKEKLFPFYGLFQEKGWYATGRAKRKNAKNPRFIPGKHFLKTAGESQFKAAERIFSTRVIASLEEIQSAGEAAGLV